MIRWGTLLIELAMAVVIITAIYKLIWHKFAQGVKIVALVFSVCAIFLSFSIASHVETPTRMVTLTALNEKNEKSMESQIYLADIVLDDVSQGIPEPISGL